MDQVSAVFFQIVDFTVIFFSASVVLIVLGYAGMIFLKKFVYKQKIKKYSGENLSFLQIKIPGTNESKEDAMEKFLLSLHRVLPNNSELSLEMVSSDQFLKFYVVIKNHLKSLVESQLYAQYPEAEIEETSEHFPEFSDNTAFIQLHFKRTSILPLNTYHNLEEDFLKSLSSMLSKTEKDEKVYLQLVLKRVGSKFYERGFRAWQQKRSVAADSPSGWKLNQELYLGKLRIAYTSQSGELAKNKAKTLTGLFKSMKGSNEFKIRRYPFMEYLSGAMRARVFDSGDMWTMSELATLYHFPYRGSVVSNVVSTTSKRAPAPDILPREGLVPPEEISLIGKTNYRNDQVTFGLKRFDRRRHLYIVGKTGSGKSRLLELLLVADIQNGDGCCLIDPHGDLADELLTFVPKERIKDVVYINPTDRDFPIGFNPLEPVTDYQMRQHLSTFFIAIFKKMLAANWNARMEHLMRYITLALLETPDSSVLGIQRILSDTTYRQRVIMQIQDPVVKGFWLNDFSVSNQQFNNEAVIPILNKVGQFTSNPIVRNMIGQHKNMLDFEDFMNTGKIVIVNLSKGKLGDENAALLGSMFITKIQQAALARAKIREEDRKDFYFYVDEFQNFATDAFSSILSEARKYRLDLTIAHQYIAQLPEEVKATAFGNVGSIISFAIGADDAAYLAKEFSPTFSPDDMINLNTREMYIKMSIDGKLAPPFSARTLNVPTSKFNYARDIIDHSRVTYGKNRVAVENEIAAWTKSTERIVSEETGEETFPEPII